MVRLPNFIMSRYSKDYPQHFPVKLQKRNSLVSSQPHAYKNSTVQPEKVTKSLQDVTAHHATEIVHINAGGKRYSTLFETLARSKSSYFAHIIRIDDTSGKVLLYHRNFIEDLSGGIFINRDGDLFGYILQYMRDGKRMVLPDDINTLKQLDREAEFFAMDNLRRIVLEKLDIEEKKREEAENILVAIKNTTNQISQNLYFNGFKR